MRVGVKPFSAKNTRCDLLICAVLPGDLTGSKSTPRRGAASLKTIDNLTDGALQKQLKRECFKAKNLESSLLKLPLNRTVKGVAAIGWPTEKDQQKEDRFDAVQRYRKLGAQIYKISRQMKAKSVALSAFRLDFKNPDHLSALVEGIELSGYEFSRYKKKTKSSDRTHAITNLTVLSSSKIAAGAARLGTQISKGATLARDLVNTPACDCTPAALVKKAREIGRKGKIKVQVYDRSRLNTLGAGALLSVARGSNQPPYLIKMVYKPSAKPKKIVAIVGKGITFDTGGYSIKSGAGMMDMKCDMSGAATVLGTMLAISTLKPRIEIRAYIPTCENMINGQATRPGDVVRAMNKKTIEVLNTDAEGRLILADALCLAEKDGCDEIIDLATLTGACMVALGDDYAGLFSDDEKITDGLIASSTASGERLWPLPLAKEYRKQIKSTVADVKNIGGKLGGAITAALFLNEFVEKTPWAHLDIAGPSFRSSASDFAPPGASGFGVRTLVRYLVAG